MASGMTPADRVRRASAASSSKSRATETDAMLPSLAMLLSLGLLVAIWGAVILLAFSGLW
jgi:hypothetical protein